MREAGPVPELPPARAVVGLPHWPGPSAAPAPGQGPRPRPAGAPASPHRPEPFPWPAGTAALPGPARPRRTHSVTRETAMRTGTLRSLKAVVMKQPKVSAAITLSEKAKSELARDSTVFISPRGPAGLRPLLGRGGAGRTRQEAAAAGEGRARGRRLGGLWAGHAPLPAPAPLSRRAVRGRCGAGSAMAGVAWPL